RLLLAISGCCGVVRSWLTTLQGRSVRGCSVSAGLDCTRSSSGIRHSQQPTLYSLEFGAADNVFLMFREPGCQGQRSCATVRWRRMCCKSAGDESRFLLVLGLQLFKHGGHCSRIVTSSVHVLDA